ncbi:hypothetical protein N9B82_00875 [Saprospiraceae bacterium]|nr:hypothetical protein [Saprospiraceae bacterium]
MKKIKKLQSECFYILQGRSSANSCFIEKVSDGELFLTYANFYLKNYLTVYDYIINRDGWMMVVKIHAHATLLELKGIDEGVGWRIVSERVRLFLATFVKVSNRKKRRTGTLVHSSYERYYFDTLREAMESINAVRQQRIKIYNGRKKYRGLKTHFKVKKSIGKGSIFLCSRDIRREKEKVSKWSEMLSDRGLTKVVLVKMLNFTHKTHNPSFLPIKLPKPPLKSKNSY